MSHAQEARFRDIFRAVHADHYSCFSDEWLNQPCREKDGTRADRPIVWSRRNGPWHRVPLLWVGSAPGNAGGRGAGDLGAHGTRIPFGGDIAGSNLEVLMSSIGLSRNDTFIVAALNQLPERGGGEPSTAEMRAPVGRYPDSIALMRDTVIAAGPALIAALGNVGLRALVTAVTEPYDAPVGDPADRDETLRLPGTKRIADAGFVRGSVTSWPDEMPPAEGFLREWRRAWGNDPLPQVVPLLHPSAQNMSPFAGRRTVFHRRMVETRDALVAAAGQVLGLEPVQPRPGPPEDGIYALPEWRDRIAERNARFDELWREKGI